jgi:hypothetical protein
MRKKYKEAIQKEHDVKLGFMSAFAKACTLALKEIPAANASIEGEEIVYRDYVDLSVAVATPKGLVTPVVRNAEGMSFLEIEKEVAALGKKASGCRSSLGGQGQWLMGIFPACRLGMGSCRLRIWQAGLLRCTSYSFVTVSGLSLMFSQFKWRCLWFIVRYPDYQPASSSRARYLSNYPSWSPSLLSLLPSHPYHCLPRSIREHILTACIFRRDAHNQRQTCCR